MKIWKHFCTITHHKYLVMKNCFKVGLYRQGLLHDMSKYSPAEFWVGCRYFQGNRSPNNAEREEKGYSSAWLHHKGRNKHHYEYWIDYGLEGEPMLTGMKMPKKYVVEMLMDRIAASKINIRIRHRLNIIFTVLQGTGCIRIPGHFWKNFSICSRQTGKRKLLIISEIPC